MHHRATSGRGSAVTVYPDVDTAFFAKSGSQSGVTDAKPCSMVAP